MQGGSELVAVPVNRGANSSASRAQHQEIDVKARYALDRQRLHLEACELLQDIGRCDIAELSRLSQQRPRTNIYEGDAPWQAAARGRARCGRGSSASRAARRPCPSGTPPRREGAVRGLLAASRSNTVKINYVSGCKIEGENMQCGRTTTGTPYETPSMRSRRRTDFASGSSNVVEMSAT